MSVALHVLRCAVGILCHRRRSRDILYVKVPHPVTFIQMLVVMYCVMSMLLLRTQRKQDNPTLSEPPFGARRDEQVFLPFPQHPPCLFKGELLFPPLEENDFFSSLASEMLHLFLSLVYLPCVLCLVAQLCLTLCNSMDCSPPGSSVYGDSPGKNIGVGRHALLQGIFPTQVFCIAGGFLQSK